MSLNKLSDIRIKIAKLKAEIASADTGGMSSPEVESFIDSQVDAMGRIYFDEGYVGLNVAHGELSPETLLKAVVANPFEGQTQEAKAIAVLAWLFPDAMKQKLSQAALPYADDSAKPDVAKLEKQLFDAEVLEEKVYLELRDAGIHPGPRRPDIDPSIVLGNY